MRVTFKHLQYFSAVVECGTVSGAAENMRVTPSSISVAITRLESEFNVRFFSRHPTLGLSLTHEGGRFLHEASLILKQARNLQAIASDLSDGVVGKLDVGCLSTIASIIMPELLSGFHVAYPDTVHQSTFIYKDHEELLNELRLTNVGLALMLNYELPRDIIFTPLIELPMYVLVSSESPLAKKKMISMHDLETEPFIQLDRSPIREHTLSLFELAGLTPNIAYSSPQYMFVRTMVGNNYGFTLTNIRPICEQALDGSELVSIPLECSTAPLALGIAMVNQQLENTSMQVFKDYCCEHISESMIPGALIPGS